MFGVGDAAVIDSPEWSPAFEIAEPFWGQWTALPYWAATTQQAVELAWPFSSERDPDERPPFHLVDLEGRRTELRHLHAYREGAARLAD